MAVERDLATPGEEAGAAEWVPAVVELIRRSLAVEGEAAAQDSTVQEGKGKILEVAAAGLGLQILTLKTAEEKVGEQVLRDRVHRVPAAVAAVVAGENWGVEMAATAATEAVEVVERTEVVTAATEASVAVAEPDGPAHSVVPTVGMAGSVVAEAPPRTDM
jgi:hypothetical protein